MKRKKIRRKIIIDDLSHIPKKYLKIRNKIIRLIKKTKKYDGKIKCPKCGNKLMYEMETFNYSFHIMCKTKGCINHFESGTVYIGRQK